MVKRCFRVGAGILVTALGIFLMPVPGPGGAPVTIAGLAILSTEFPWARRFLQRLVSLLQRRRSRWERLALVVGLVAFWIIGSMVGWRLLVK